MIIFVPGNENYVFLDIPSSDARVISLNAQTQEEVVILEEIKKQFQKVVPFNSVRLDRSKDGGKNPMSVMASLVLIVAIQK